MEKQVDRLVQKTWNKYKATPTSKRVLIAVSGIPGSVHVLFLLMTSCLCPSFARTVGKTALAKIVVEGLNNIHNEQAPACASSPVATSVPMDGYHLSRAQLSAMPDPTAAHRRRGAAFTFDDKAFLELVKKLRKPLLPESKTVYAPSFDHAIKDPVADDIPIHPTSRVVILEGNYLSLNQGLWKEAAELMDELWFVEVDFETARKRLVVRHVAAGIAKDEEEASNRADEIDLVNGRQIVDQRLEVQEIVVSKEDKRWHPGGQQDSE